LLENLADGSPNPFTYAYDHYAIPVTTTVFDQTDASNGLVVSVRPPRKSVDKCKDRGYKRKNKQVQQKLAGLEMDAKESDYEYEGDAMHTVRFTVRHSLKRNARQRHGLDWLFAWVMSSSAS
jgi:hypothetical protein